MKRLKFLWLLLPLLLAGTTVMHLASCDDSDELQTNSETVAPATDDNDATTTDDDPEVTSRSCTCSQACPIDINIVSTGSASLTICGDLNATVSCSITNSNCTSTTYFPRSTTITGSSCICVPPGNIFRVTNNGIANVTIDIIITGTLGPISLSNQTIPANGFLDFEVNISADCDVAVAPC